MAIKRAILTQTTSQEQPGPPDPTPPEPEGELRRAAAAASPQGDEPAVPDLTSVVSDEILRQRIRALIDEKPKASALKRLLNHPLGIGLIIAAVGFVLTGVVGGLLTYYSSVKQQELASERSFNDEINKISVQKIGEVWEQVDKNEVLLDGLLEKAKSGNVSDAQKAQNVEAISDLIREDRLVVNKNRFWLGEQHFRELQDYLEKNKRTALNVLLADPDENIEPLIDERNRAKKYILQIRENMREEGRPGR